MYPDYSDEQIQPPRVRPLRTSHPDYRGKNIANYRHSHSAQKDVYVEGCQRCDFLLAKKAVGK